MTNILKLITDCKTKCPFLQVMQRFYMSSNQGNDFVSNTRARRTSNLEWKKCLFLSTVYNFMKLCIVPFYSSSIRKDNPFDYYETFSKYNDMKRKDGSYRVFRNISRMAKEPGYAYNKKEGLNDTRFRKVSVWCSNDYLGLSRHPRIIKAAIKGLKLNGNGAGGTRNIAGSNNIHNVVEQELAKFHDKEMALLFNSCYLANETTLSTLGKMLPDCHIFSDEKNHASMIEGISHSRCKKTIFRHNDMDHLEQLLKQTSTSTPKIIAFESVYSMDGNICEMEAIINLAHKYGAITFCDEVHAIGLYGKVGSGISDVKDLSRHIDIISGTLGKGIGAIGGYICGNVQLVDFIRSYGKGFIFTTSLPPSVLYGAYEAIKIISSDEGNSMRKKLHENVAFFKKCMSNIDIPIHDSDSHIIKIKVGDPKLCESIAQTLLNRYDIYVQPINYPTVSRGDEMLRIVPTCHHSREMIVEFTDSLQEIWQEMLGQNVPIKCAHESTKCCTLSDKKSWNIINIINCPVRKNIYQL